MKRRSIASMRPVEGIVLAAATLLTLVALVPGFTRADEAADPRRPAAIKTEGVPVVPPGLMEGLSRYQSVRGAAFLGFAPDGSGILIRTRFGNAGQLHRVYTPGGRREQITFFEEPVRGAFVPESKAGQIILAMSRGGNENDQLSLFQPGEYVTELFTDGKSRNTLGPFRADGAQLVIGSNRRNGRDTDLYVVDLKRPDSQELLLEVKNEFWSASDWSRDGKRLALLRYVSANESYPAVMDLASRTITPLSLATSERASYSSLAFSPDGRTMYLTSDARGEFHELATYDLKSGEYQWLTGDIPWDVEELEVDPTSGRVVFAVNADGASDVYLLEGERRRKLDLPLGIVSGLEFSPDGGQLGFTLSRPDEPPDAYSLELSSGELVRWTYSEAGGLDPRRFIRPEAIAFESFDGRKIPAWYYRPRGATEQSPAAVVIDIHGGPEGQSRPYFSPTTQYYLSELGVAVIYPNVRGSSGYGKSYLLLDNAEKREDSVKDIGALLDWIATRPELDAKRVAVTGGSYGGYMVLASLVHFGDRIKAGIDSVGIANFITFLERTSAYRQDLRRAEYGDERDLAMRATFERISPVNSAEKIRAALMVVHGVNDPRVPFSEAEQIAAKVRATGNTVWTVYAENEGHGMAKKDNRDYVTAAEVLFLKETLGK